MRLSRPRFLTLALVGLLLATFLAGCIGGTQEPPAPEGGDDAPPAGAGLAFSPALVVDGDRDGSEPSIGVDPDGRIFISAPAGLTAQSYLWVSEDNGTTFRYVETMPAASPTGTGAGGGDTSIAIGKDGAIYVTDLWVGSNTVYSSHDHGNTWFAAPISSTVPYYDREWNAVDGKGHAYLLARTFTPGSATWMSRSDDGGKTWLTVGNPWVNTGKPTDGGQNGPLIVNPKTDALHGVYTCGSGKSVCVTTSTDLGMTWKQGVAASGNRINNIFPAIAADTAGNLYVAFADRDGDNLTVKLAASADGATWTTPVTVSQGPGQAIFPWIVAGDAGRVDVVWYGTNATGNNNNVDDMKGAQWRVYLAQSLDALNATPTFEVAAVTPDPIHNGTVSTMGLSTSPNAPDRCLGDFFTVALDPQGYAHLSFNKCTRGSDPTRVLYARQTGGASLYAAGGQTG